MNNTSNFQKEPLVSVLIPLYNAEKYFGECIQSVINQTYKNIEIIIVDDGSTDNSLNIARKYEQKYHNIKVYTQKNCGAASARNKAFSFSTGDYIQYLDADDILDLDKVAIQITQLSLYHFDPEVVANGRWCRFYYNLNNKNCTSLCIYKNYSDTLKFLVDAWSNAHYSIIHSWLISREIHQKVGIWDPAISVLDDSVFFAKVAFLSKKIIYVDKSIVYWRQDNTESLSKNKSWNGMESHLTACNNYAEIVQEKLDYPGMRKALASEYSKLIYRAYPDHMDLVEKAQNSLKKLGYQEPLPMPTKKFKFVTKIFGFYPTARLFGFKDKVIRKIRELKG
ncbi:glycosyltransferase family 2 protein [Sulfurovum sp.]|uniref:glycosyltransferase family 2 protein n=1 Tax=Sulfurovum sp. TaxID=1969726 RepID=UPI0025CF661E|nr:glycosyltransferase family 2 protein [Sulfurovum sp.]